MALIKCKECNSSISDKASTCPSCGAPVEKKRKKNEVSGFIFLVVIVGLIWWLSSDSEPTENTTANASSVESESEKECAKGDLSCWGEKNYVSASVYCKEPIERLAKYNHKWTDQFLEPKMSHYRWADVENNVVTFIGDKIQFQNGFGAFVPMVYECDLSADGKTVLDVRVREGRLPG
jgi:hypothetical protein